MPTRDLPMCTNSLHYLNKFRIFKYIYQLLITNLEERCPDCLQYSHEGKGDLMNAVSKNIVGLLALVLYAGSHCNSLYPTKSIRHNADAEWAIIGAGPAGIIVVGLLLDLGTDPKSIIWVDPEFNVGRMGKYYSTVPGNAKTKIYIEFLQSCQTFQEANSPAAAKLFELDQEM